MSRHGLTAEQAVFGRSPRFTELSTEDDGDDVLVSVLGANGPTWRASQIRTVAKMHLLQGDASDMVRRAILCKAPVAMGELCPGSRAYFCTCVINPGRNRQDPDRWRGPATVVSLDRKKASQRSDGSREFFPAVCLISVEL